MQRLNVQYDLLPRESEILRLKFWDQAFSMLKERGAIHLETAGRNRGCWIMPVDSTGAAVEDPPEEPDAAGRSPDDAKVIMRSNGTVTYVGKDIAYQLWKFGLLERDFSLPASPPLSRRASGLGHHHRPAPRRRSAVRPCRDGLQRD